MEIASTSRVTDLATEWPATIKVFQQYGIDVCCRGKLPLAEACTEHGLDVARILDALHAVTASPGPRPHWEQAPLSELIAHIQAEYHQPLRTELPRLRDMLAKVVSRHGDRYSGTLLPLAQVFDTLQRDVLDHISKEDAVLFPAIRAIESGALGAWIGQPIAVMEAEHEEAGRALAEMRRLTAGYAPPDDACPTFRGLYCELAEFEHDMQQHVHLENNILFPRATRLAQSH